MSAPHPLLVIGLDGATFDLLDPLFARGDLPNLARLADEGMRTELNSTQPPVTLPAWTSFLTGASPGTHGVTDIFMRGSAYGLVPANASHRQLPTFLAHLSRMGCQVASLGVPGTFPPEQIEGICISGFDAPGVSHAGREAFWPPSLHEQLQRFGGWRYATFNEYRSDRRQLARALAALEQDIAAKERIAVHLLRSQPWDLFFLHLQASDTAAHHLWHTWDRHSPRFDSSGEFRDALPRIYRRLDSLIGRLVAMLPAQARVLVVSDHGMGGASDIAVHLNRFLQQRGLLTFVPQNQRTLRRATARSLRGILGRLPPVLLGAGVRAAPAAVAERLVSLARGTAVDFSATLAFSDELDYAPSIWINRVGCFPNGLVDEATAEQLTDRLAAELLDLRHPGTDQALVAAVHRRESLATGPLASRFADLVIEPAWPGGYRPSFLPSDGPGPVVRQLSAKEHAAAKGQGIPGVHRREGVFLAWGDGLPALELPVLEIAEAGALVYSLLGLPVPSEVEARVPSFLDGLVASATSQTQAPARSGPALGPAHDPAGALVVTERLRALGYIE